LSFFATTHTPKKKSDNFYDKKKVSFKGFDMNLNHSTAFCYNKD